MTFTPSRRLALPLTLLLGGCSYPLCADADSVTCQLASRPIDVRPAPRPAELPAPRPDGEESEQKPGDEPAAGIRGLKVPPEVPGAGTPDIVLPNRTDPDFEKKMEEALKRYFPPLADLGPNPVAEPGPGGRPLELADLQRVAMSTNPVVKQAWLDVEAARGAAIQAGLYPNPSGGFEADSVGQAGTPGMVGGFLDQKIVTAGKLKLARAVAEVDVRNAELAFEKARFDVMGQVRASYFAVLSAQENMRVSLAFSRFTEEVYRIQTELLRGRQAAAYEPIPFRVLARQARLNVISARHAYQTAWKQLAASLGAPGLRPTQLAGRIDLLPLPAYGYGAALDRVLNNHSDVRTARNAVLRAQYNLRLQQVTPVPDPDFRVTVQKDSTALPKDVVSNWSVSVPLPVWDRNQGGIRQAEAQLARAMDEEHRVRDDLTGKLADAYGRYRTNMELIAEYGTQIMPDQVQVFRRLIERYNTDKPGTVSFNDVSVAQQNLAASLTSYLTALAAQWTAAVDIANLLQTEDLFGTGGETYQLPDLVKLLPLPCEHSCSAAPAAARNGADGSWPPSVPEKSPAEAPPKE